MSIRHSNSAVGFTLVELMVVIAILGALLGLLLPQLGRINDKAKRVQCSSNLRELTLAFGQFAKDNEIYPDREKWLERTAGEGLRSGQLYRYLGEKKVYACPSDSDLREAGKRLTSYCYNSWFHNRNANQQPDMSLTVVFIEVLTGKPKPFVQFFNPEDSVALTDRHSGGGLLAFGDNHVDYLTQATFSKDVKNIFRETVSSHRQ